MMDKLPEYNILLLGETGTGKSTTINAWANYFSYENFEEAKEGDFETIIPTRFPLPDPDNSDEEIEIVSNVIDSDDSDSDNDEAELAEVGDGINENFRHGNSVTQSPFSYEFQFNDRILRIIDTPGVGDTGGGTIDQENFTKILAHLHRYKQLHGIVILFKATETRTTAFFRYCITELFVHLPKSACANMIFCFTFSRSDFYAPGPGYQTMRAFLNSQMKELNIALDPSRNCFFIDNEAYRYLVAKKQDYQFKEEDDSNYVQSWVKSVEQSNKMFGIIAGLKPHNLLKTSLLNNEHKFIEVMAKPMVQLKKLTNANVSEQTILNSELLNLKNEKNELVNISTVEVENVESEPISSLRTVCSTVPKCCEVLKVEGNDQNYYKSACHENCTCAGDNVLINAVGDASLRRCTVLCSQSNCTVCGCPWQVHLRIKEKQTKMKRKKFIPQIIEDIKEVKDKIREKKQKLETLLKAEKEYESESEAIMKIAVLFACNLVKNSNVAFNKFLGPYLDLLLDHENNERSSRPDFDPQNLNLLTEFKMLHQQCVEILQKAEIQFSQNRFESHPKLEHISWYRAELTRQKHTGQQYGHLIASAEWNNSGNGTRIRFRKRCLQLKHNFDRQSANTIQLVNLPPFSNEFYAVLSILVLFLCYIIMIIFYSK